MKKKRGLIIKINLSNRWLYFLITLGILAIVGAGVYALTPGTKPSAGHLASELAPPSPCIANQFLQFDGTNWKCAAGGSSSFAVSNITVYKITNDHCINKGNVSFTTTCRTTVCAQDCCTYNSKKYDYYFRCDGSCPSCPGGYTACSTSISPDTCSNPVAGNLVYG